MILFIFIIIILSFPALGKKSNPMSRFNFLHEQFKDYLSLSPSKKHEKLLSILNRHKSYSLIDQSNQTGQDIQIKQNKNNEEILRIVKRKIQETQKIPPAEMNRTNFMISYMDKMKKQRKRQQKKKVNSCMYKRQGVDPCSKSIYVFLPNVAKSSSEDQKKINQGEGEKKIVTTINLFQNRGNSGEKEHRIRTHSLQQKSKILHKKGQEQTFEKKVQQVINDIKKNRKKSKQFLSVFDEKSNRLVYFQNKNHNQVTFIPSPHTQSLPQVKKNPQKIPTYQKPNKKIERMPTFTSRQLEPWSNSTQLHDFNLSSQRQGIEEFYFY